MQKQKIYWFVQQLHNIGGTEMVTIQIINMLSKDYDIHLMVLSEKAGEPLYKTNPEVEITYLGVPKECCQFDKNFYSLAGDGHIFKAIGLFFRTIHIFTFGSRKYKKIIDKMTSKEDILIMSSEELFLFAPKDRFVYKHFHYNSKLYKLPMSRFIRFFARKPNFTIYLSNSTMKALNPKNKNCTYIYNPTRFSRVLNEDYHNNNLIFVGRFELQKDPMFLLKAMKEADELKLDYKLTIYGNGSLRKEMDKYIKDNHLNKITIIDNCFDLKPHYLESDLLLSTSVYEGFPLVTIEANSLSCPALWLDIKDPTEDMIIPGLNGYVVYKRSPKVYAQKLKEILDDKEHLISMKKASYDFSEKYLESKVYGKWRTLFDSHKERIKK